MADGSFYTNGKIFYTCMIGRIHLAGVLGRWFIHQASVVTYLREDLVKGIGSAWWQEEDHGVGIFLLLCQDLFRRGWNSRTFVRTRLGPAGYGVILNPCHTGW